MGSDNPSPKPLYLMPPEHTHASRDLVGPAAALSVVCPFVAETDPVIARGKARKGLAYDFSLDYYHREWTKLGFSDSDFADSGKRSTHRYVGGVG
jgi:hypothetical protein